MALPSFVFHDTRLRPRVLPSPAMLLVKSPSMDENSSRRIADTLPVPVVVSLRLFPSSSLASCPPVGTGGATGDRVRGGGLRRPRVRHDSSSGRRVQGDSTTELQGGSGLLLEGAEHGQELVHRQVGRGRATKGL